MSIFKSTLKPIIASQLKARESIVSQWGDSGTKDNKDNPVFKAGITPRDDKFLRYTNGKNAWVKMTSFVNYTDPKGRYTGDQLSRKYVLEGGTLLNNTSLRSGVSRIGGSYGSDLDKISSDPKSNTVDRLFGIRPMPGIESANIINISAYGSLREATINFYAWDKHQLSELEILFMRPGYTCLLEWGWSQYLKHDIAKDINSVPDNISIENVTTGIDAFAKYQNEDAIYDQIEKTSNKYYGNYDAMLGFVKNFSWKLMPNGGYQCTTTLISRGEALETLKASTNPNIILGSEGSAQSLASSIDESKPVVSFYEKIFLNLIGYINDSEISAQQGQLNTSTTNADGTPNNMTNDQQNAVRSTVNEAGENILSKVSSMVLKRVKSDGDIGSINGLNLKSEGFYIRPVDGGINGSAIEYITLDSFIAILNTFFIPKSKDAEKKGKQINIVDIVLPYQTPFLISEDTVSVDPTTCLLYNPKATFVTGDSTGFTPELYNVWRLIEEGGSIKIQQSKVTNTPNIQSNNGNGILGNILISIQKLIDIYRSLYGSSDGVAIVDLLTAVLDNINLALGGLNNFKLYTTKNTIQIIDAQYLEKGKDNKFIFDPIGLKSICRDVRINSRIFSEQSSMIAIGAAAGEYTNLGDIYSSTQAAFNKGLKDRILNNIQYGSSKDTLNIAGTEYTGSTVYYYQIANNVISLSNHLKYKVLGVNDYQNKATFFKVTRVPQDSEVVNASSLLQSVHYQINGKDVNYKSFIPFELEIELDGLGGFITGQIFKISKTVLPKDYGDKNIGFIITKQSHNLRNNDWVTTLTTQVCLLDNESIPSPYVDKKQLRKIIDTIVGALKTTSYLKYAMADYLVYLTYKLLTNGDNPPIDPNSITGEKIKNVLEKIGGEDAFDFKTYLRLWVNSFQLKNENLSGLVLPHYNPSYRNGITPFSETHLYDSFPKTVDDIAIVVDPASGGKIPFNYDYFTKFIFDKESIDNVAANTNVGKIKLITGEYLEENPELLSKVSKSFNQIKSYLNPNQIIFSVNGSVATLQPIYGEESVQAYLSKYISSNVMDVKSLYGSYLNYITNVYFRSIPGQEVFTGAGTSPISLYWGFDDTENKSYFIKYWATSGKLKEEMIQSGYENPDLGN